MRLAGSAVGLLHVVKPTHTSYRDEQQLNKNLLNAAAWVLLERHCESHHCCSRKGVRTPKSSSCSGWSGSTTLHHWLQSHERTSPNPTSTHKSLSQRDVLTFKTDVQRSSPVTDKYLPVLSNPYLLGF